MTDPLQYFALALLTPLALGWPAVIICWWLREGGLLVRHFDDADTENMTRLD